MAVMQSQIIGSFEDLGKQVGSEVVKAPTEIAGKALESLGAGTKGPKGQTVPSIAPSEKSSEKPSPLDEFSATKDARTKELMARRALEYLAAKGRPEPSVRERLEREEAEKKAAEEKKAKESLKPLEQPKGKRRRGDLYGAGAKATATEKKSVRQD